MFCILGNKEVPKIENVRVESVALRVEIKHDIYTVSFINHNIFSQKPIPTPQKMTQNSGCGKIVHPK